jgi:hypothetical protein
MRKIWDWFFLSNTQYWEKYILPGRLGSSPYEERIVRRRMPDKPKGLNRLLIWLIGGF